jgi:hypothetical protein
MNYTKLENFKNIYLEDSFVLSIKEEANTIKFECEFVLTEENKHYHNPKEGEQYCYKNGIILFKNIINANWEIEYSLNGFNDAFDEIDLGNIDVFEIEDNLYNLEGDWGKVSITTNDTPMIIYNESQS